MFLGCWNLKGPEDFFFFLAGGEAFSWTGIPSITLQCVSLQDGNSHHAPPGQETCPSRLQWVSFGVLSARAPWDTMCAPAMLTSHPGSGVLGKKCGTIILLAEELGNCRVSRGGAEEGA